MSEERTLSFIEEEVASVEENMPTAPERWLPPDGDLSVIPEMFLTEAKKAAEAMRFEETDNGRLRVLFNVATCNSFSYLKYTHWHEKPFPLGNRKRIITSSDSLFHCVVKKEEREKRGCTGCNEDNPCKVALAAYYKYLTETDPKEFERQRSEYRKSKDKVDARIIYRDASQLHRLHGEMSDYPYVNPRTLDKIRAEIDASEFYLKPEKINDQLRLAMYDNCRIPGKELFNKEVYAVNSAEICINRWKHNVPMYSGNNGDQHFLRLFVLSLLAEGEYQEFHERCSEVFRKSRSDLPGTSYYGYIAGNDRYSVEDAVRNVCCDIHSSFLLNSPSYIKITAVEMMQRLARAQSRIDIIEYLHIREDVIWVITGWDEFLRFTKSRHGDDSALEERQINHFLKELAEFADRRFIILAGTKQMIDEVMRLNSAYPLMYSENATIIVDYTIEQIYAVFKKELRGVRLNSQSKRKFTEYLTYNRGAFPFDNRILAEYLANYASCRGKFALPADISGIRERDFMKDLNDLIGLTDVKKTVKELYEFTRFQLSAEKQGLNIKAFNRHLLFLGSSGTGKTTVARLIARALYDIGAIRKNKLVEVERKDLIAEYLGQTAAKTSKVVNEALGGVLFIDEAYSLTPDVNYHDYGNEAIATLITAMENHKDDLVVIFAGYETEMRRFIDSNPGILSRIGYTFTFPDYTESELVQMYTKNMEKSGFSVSQNCREPLRSVIKYFKDMKNLGNGRFVDKLIQITLQKKSGNKNEIADIKEEDIPTISDIISYMPDRNIMVTPDSVSEEEKLRVAYHELGHAVISYKLRDSLDLSRITVESTATGALGYVQYKNSHRNLSTKTMLRNDIAVLLGGIAAEEVLLGEYSGGGKSDLRKASDIALRMVTEYGMSTSMIVRDRNNEEAIKEASEIMREQFDRARGLVSEDVFKPLAEILIKKGTIDEDEIVSFLKGVTE